ncbi:hypothetical protein DYB32_005542, partial [Aphanomyces invadans]
MIDSTQYHHVVDVETCFHAYKQLENHHAIKWNPKQETLQAFLERFDILLRKLQAADCAMPDEMAVVKVLALM